MTGAAFASRERQLERRGFLVALAVYLAVACGLLPFYRYEIDPDGISYLSIAQKYLRGDLAHAVNGYWAPLYSWLLVPFLAAGLPPILAAKVLGVLVGLVALVGTQRLLRRSTAPASIRGIVLVGVTGWLARAALREDTPDGLAAAVFVWYCERMLALGSSSSAWAAAAGGAVAALGYYSKAFMLPYVLVHAGVLFGWRIFRAPRGERGSHARSALVTMGVFALLVAPWIAVISAKYGAPTFSTAGAFNRAMVAPPGGFPRNLEVIPPLVRGLMPPANETAVSVWEDISATPVQDWNPFGSVPDMIHAAKIVFANSPYFIEYAFRFLLLWPLLVLFAVAAWLRRPPARGILWFAFLSAALYVAGYALFTEALRYFYPLVPLIAVTVAATASASPGEHPRAREWSLAMASLAAFLMFVSPVAELGIKRNINRAEFELARRLAPEMPAGTRVAGDGRWIYGLYLSFFADWRYYGITRAGADEDEIREQIERYGVTHYIVWNLAAPRPALLDGRRELTGGAMGDVRVYDLRTAPGTGTSRPPRPRTPPGPP